MTQKKPYVLHEPLWWLRLQALVDHGLRVDGEMTKALEAAANIYGKHHGGADDYSGDGTK